MPYALRRAHISYKYLMADPPFYYTDNLSKALVADSVPDLLDKLAEMVARHIRAPAKADYSAANSPLAGDRLTIIKLQMLPPVYSDAGAIG